jgi:RNA polymerase sigma factor (sigma-70 family)
MPDANDIDLIREYAGHGSEPAFAKLVQRHINLVYSVALRCTGNSHDAQDVSQAVFIVLARKVSSLRHRTTLTGWLYETTRFVSLRQIRARARQQFREQDAYMQSILTNVDSNDVWRQIEPLLEEGMARLDEKDRTLLALRFFENKSGAETAGLLGIQESAAHKRTARALEKLRQFFARRGVTSTAAAIAGTMSAHAVQSAPEFLAKTVTTAALAGSGAAGGSILTLAKGALKVMAWSTAKTAIVGVAVLGMAVLLVNQHQNQVRLREQNEALRQRMDRLQAENDDLSKKRARISYLPAPQLRADALAAESLKRTHMMDRVKDKPLLTLKQLEPYLKANGRSAASLLAAFRTSRDASLLKEAMQKYPNDPQVAFEAAFDTDLSPEEKRQWLNTFEQSAPDNSLANYLSAFNYFNSGQTNQALQEMAGAAGKQIDDYTTSRIEDDTEAYLSAGYSLAEAKATGSMQLLLPQLAEAKQVALAAVDVANGYSQAGDSTSAQTVLQMAANLGQQYANPATSTEVSDLVGLAIEKIALSAMDPNAPYGDTGLTVQDELDQIAQQKAAVRSLNQQTQPLMPLLSDQDWIIYTDRQKIFGEQNAMQWVLNQYGGQPQQ